MCKFTVNLAKYMSLRSSVFEKTLSERSLQNFPQNLSDVFVDGITNYEEPIIKQDMYGRSFTTWMNMNFFEKGNK